MKAVRPRVIGDAKDPGAASVAPVATARVAKLDTTPAQRVALTLSTVDPFAAPVKTPSSTAAPRLPTPAPQPPPLVLPTVVTTPPAPPPPPAPSFAGRMLGPGGEHLVFLRDGAELKLAVVGQSTRTGYRVEAIDAQAVRLLLPSFEHRVTVAIPQVAP